MNLDVLKNINEPVFYVTNEVGRGIGLEKLLPNYHIICLDDHPLVDLLEKAGVSVFCLERKLGGKNIVFRSSSSILSQPSVIAFIQEKSAGRIPQILFFKPQKKIEFLAREHHWQLLGNTTNLSRQFEDKIAFFNLCQKEKIPVPEGEIMEMAKGDWSLLTRKYGEPIVVQFGRGWAGNSTFLIDNESHFLEIKKQFGHAQAKICRFVKGITVINNAVVFQGKVFSSRPALQIASNKVLTSTQAGTGGRQWPALLKGEQKKEIKSLTEKVGLLMAKKGYLGFFGLDFLVEDQTGRIYLAENNSRLTASVPFFTKLEIGKDAFPLLGYHLLSFLSDQRNFEEKDYEAPVLLGSEIVARNTLPFPVQVTGELVTGIYRQNLALEKESYFLEGGNRFWLECAGRGRIVNPEIELIKLDTFSPVADSLGRLLPQYEKIITEVRNKLDLKRCPR